MDDIQLGIEVALALLLVTTIFYSLHLGRALAVLRRDRAELGNLIVSLERSCGEARTGIEQLRQATEISTRQLGKSVESGKALRAELEELCRLGEELVARVQARGSVQRNPGDDMVPAQGDERPQPSYDPRGKGAKSEAERELLRALRMQRI
ncbi:DUF6468 domain-containing protein [Acidomonas methanolica]|uniref:DUF6468 domain-containing protein n=1 Tax=Acidomonas methanolica NBRC 104435 TaxID=1231351 RepID=A0A023D1R1_ACIMT|nr:DUF6468 domain-containing protein [Acidomonas methanolica]MBU2654564.1 hypothetical protein [Acidomonas methanolica]TCS27437.1 hypothetical protein EDC31_11041 [Acidomonas methanolica]GAJ28082.1 hypothetical protein Amme_013_046 [Acidomonas methanolica NBRC 104435]GBQ51771.1 hypothetical protein AA0498_1569 [Acidomonas methanolica]GEK98656.1 hypothetical protein AME01nite_11550 [Acidomonas methanolica NBRC 104435]